MKKKRIKEDTRHTNMLQKTNETYMSLKTVYMFPVTMLSSSLLSSRLQNTDSSSPYQDEKLKELCVKNCHNSCRVTWRLRKWIFRGNFDTSSWKVSNGMLRRFKSWCISYHISMDFIVSYSYPLITRRAFFPRSESG